MMIMAAMIITAAAGTSMAAESIRVLLVPFSINASQDLAFLQRGISDMLTSRLEQPDKVDVVTAGRPGDDIEELAAKHRADYVVFGSVTVLDGRVSTDCRVVKGTQVENPVLSFGRTGRRQADAIDHIDELAGQINAQLLGRTNSDPGRAVTAAPVAPPAATGGPTIEIPVAHSTQSASGFGRGKLSNRDADALVPLRLRGMGDFNERLNGLAVGDVDGDGVVEIVTIGNSRLYVHRVKQDRWVRMARYDGRGKYVGVDMADLNGNGRDEIFVTNFDDTESRVISFVMEWDGKSLQRIAGRLPWYFRVVDAAAGGKMLVGQKQSTGDRFTPGIYRMKWQDGAYRPGDRLPVPRRLNVFGFAYGAVRSTDALEAVAYNSDGYLEILDRKDGQSAVSTETYGGGPNAIVFTDKDQYDVRDNIYLAPRIHLQDLDGDGIQEMLVVNNETTQLGGGILDRHRSFKKGRIEWLRWHAQGIRTVVQSLDVARFIADSALADLDGDGTPEIVAVVVKSTGGVIAKGSSYVTMFGIGPAQQGSR